MPLSQKVKGDGSAILSAALFALGAVLVKFLTAGFDGFFISFFRFAVGIALSLILILSTKSGFGIHSRKDVILRGVYGSLSMILYFVSIQLSGSGRATLFNNTFPIFVAIFGALFFRERLSLRQVVCTLICCIGVFAIFWDGSGGNFLGDLIGLASGVLGGFSVIYTKRARMTDNSYVIYGTVCVIGLIFSSFSVPQAANLEAGSFFLLLLAGAVVFFAQVTFTYGIKYMPAVRASLVSLLKVPMTIALGALLGEALSWGFAAGTAVILAGIIMMEAKKEKRAR